MDVLHSCVAMLGVVLLILGLRVNAVIALLLGCLYLGLATGLGMDATVAAIGTGFGDIMAEVGLLIGFGVLIGSLLLSLGTIQSFTHALLRSVGPRRFPYALSVAFSAVFPSIYGDVQLVLAAPLVRTAAPRLGRNGLGMLSGALTAGILTGYVFVVPGLVTLTISGMVDAPLGSMLIYGFLVGPATAIITVLIWAGLIRIGIWNPDKDEVRGESVLGDESETGAEHGSGTGSGVKTQAQKVPALGITLLPIVVPLVMIATSTIAGAAGVESGVLVWLGNPVLALFVGLLGAYVLVRASLGRESVDQALSKGLSTTGQILLITGVGGSLGAVIAETKLKGVLGDLFSAQSGTSVVGALLVAYLVAALLHLVIGSMSVSGAAAAGILAPIMGELDVAPAVIALAISAGVLFGVQLNSNFFWMFQTLLGVTTSGTFKALSLVTVIASLVALPIILGLGLIT